MSKKVVAILSILAVVIAGAAMGLWFTVKGKTEEASKSLAALSEFSTGSTFEARLKAPAKAKAAIDGLRDDNKKKDETIADREGKISGLEKNKKDLEENVSELEKQRSELTRARDDALGKVDNLSTRATSAENKVKDLEGQVAKQAEEFAKKEQELNDKVSADKNVLVAEAERARRFYNELYNFCLSKGLQPKLPRDPSAPDKQSTGPAFARFFVAEVVGFDARQGIAVLNVGSDAGLLTNQGFELRIGDEAVAKVSVAEVFNSSMSSVNFMPGSAVPNLTPGTTVKLVPLSEVAAKAPASAAPVPAAAAPASAATK